MQNKILIIMLFLIAGSSLCLLFINRENIKYPNITSMEQAEPTIQENMESYTENVTSDGSVKKYVSPSLGVEFEYLKNIDNSELMIKEIGNKIYIYQEGTNYMTGQYLEVFKGDKNKTYKQNLEEKFLTTSQFKANCEFSINVLTAGMASYPVEYKMATIKYKKEFENVDELFAAEANRVCPFPYTQSNGISYFLFKSDKPDNYAYVQVGQNIIPADKDMLKGWQDTIRFID